MSLQDGMSAIRLEMPPRVPRTEYSAEFHWDLVKAVTGIDVSPNHSPEARELASQAFRKAWNYDFVWSILIGSQFLGQKRTRMGHAVYASGGVDYDDQVICPFQTPEEVLEFDPWKEYGAPPEQSELIRQFEAHFAQNMSRNPDAVNMTGVYITCISGLIEIFGWDMLLLAAGWDPEAFGAMTGRYCSWIGKFFEALAASSVPVVMIHDDIVWTSGPFVHPDWYRKFVFPNCKRMFAPIVESGKKIIYTSDGTYTMFVDDIAACGVHGFVMEPTTDMGYVADKYGKTHVFIGNADTRVLLSGSREDIRAEVKRCMDIGKKYPGFFMAVGNHIPSNTPVENALYYNECYEEMSRR